MGEIYTRGDSQYLWMWFHDAQGIRRQRSCKPFKVGQEDQAKKLLRAVERRIQAEKDGGLADSGPVTVKRWADRYLKLLKERRPRAEIDQRSHLDNHILPALGELVLAEVRPQQLVDLFAAVQQKVAPKTVHNIYGTTRKLFRAAFRAELISASPCVLSISDGDLPERVDADPAWRPTAVYTREEMEALLSDHRVPFVRRVLYGLMFAGAMRFGEAAARTWRDYDRTTKPLGRLLIHSSYSTRLKVVKAPKTRVGREMPVHPALASLLERWHAAGWESAMGRPPQPSDLIVPTKEGRNRKVNRGLRQLHHDLEILGFRKRRQHDGRRTFISLTRSDGAKKDILRWATHGPPKSVIDEYTTPTWESLCGEVEKLQFNPPKADEAVPSAPESIDMGAVTFVLRSDVGHEKGSEVRRLGASLSARGTGLEHVPTPRKDDVNHRNLHPFSLWGAYRRCRLPGTGRTAA